MSPSIELIIAAIFVGVMLMAGGFWLVSTFRAIKTSAGLAPAGALSLDSTLTSGSEHKQMYVLAGSHGVNETSLAVRSPSPSTHESRSEDIEQISNIASRSGPTPAAAPVVALTGDVAGIVKGPTTNIDAAITPAASGDGRAVGAAVAAGTLPNPDGGDATSTASDSTVSATTTRKGRVEANTPTEADTTEKSSRSRIAPDVTAADPPNIAAETALAGEKRVAPNPSSASSLGEPDIPAATHGSPKATIAKARRPQKPRKRTRRLKVPRRTSRPRAKP